jgi:F0F1-type ATP synthase epsilon subunit
VSILADIAELATDIDVARAQAAADRLSAAGEQHDDAAEEEVRAGLARATARLRAAELGGVRR